ncbi:c-type cytochrome [Oceanobacillus alkalisoli]|uniref:c-type cytochrome n=1 Tax=Oceanobacillus alkalisoli TaxID=2925113 RepID=UPI001EEFF7DE|nr:cytochrome c [Oceanobacillus alkalisoli]MCF3941789.1 cytochrome c [Oceanobacillus alkalisoli]MCG5103069.1 cytochrome c [Oceanobacillus alkalisoli]
MKNAVVPYAIIAVLGIVAVVIISAIGLNNQAEIAEGGDEGEETEQVENGGEEGGETAGGDADAVFQNNCAMCHGADLTGGGGPDLTAVGASYSADEIKDIIQNGKGSMPAVPAVQGEELDALATWLSEKQ